MQIVVETSLLPHHGKCTVEKKFEGLSCKLSRNLEICVLNLYVCLLCICVFVFVYLCVFVNLCICVFVSYCICAIVYLHKKEGGFDL